MKHSLPSFEMRRSYRRHRQQFAWQILAPILVFSLLALTAAGFLAWGGAADTRHLADVALIWLTLPLLIVALALVLLLGVLIYLLARLLKVAPVYTDQGQRIVYRIAAVLGSLADKVVQPIIKVNQFLAALQYLMRK